MARIATALRMIVLGCTQLGRLDEAEAHLRTAIERAATPRKRAEFCAQLAHCAMRRGRLDEAERMSREAEKLAPGRATGLMDDHRSR